MKKAIIATYYRVLCFFCYHDKQNFVGRVSRESFPYLQAGYSRRPSDSYRVWNFVWGEDPDEA